MTCPYSILTIPPSSDALAATQTWSLILISCYHVYIQTSFVDVYHLMKYERKKQYT